MLVRIHFGRGPAVTRRQGKNGRMAQLAASLLTLASISCFIFAIWRIGADLAFAGDFAIKSGFLSHWQVWMSAAALSQYACWKLTHYARQSQDAVAPPEFGTPEASEV